jgi:hypothetical protein
MTRRPSEPTGLLASFIARCNAAPSTVQFVLARVGGNAVVTHAMLWDGGQRYAHLYRRTGAAQGTVVLIALQSSPDLLYAFVGAILAGCVPAMMPLPSIKQDPARFWDSHTRLSRRHSRHRYDQRRDLRRRASSRPAGDRHHGGRRARRRRSDRVGLASGRGLLSAA